MVPLDATLFRALLVLLLSTACLQACADDSLTNASVFSPQVEEVVVEVDYQDGAEPFVNNLQNTNNPWVTLFQPNIEALFQGGNKRFSFQNELAQMEKLEGISKTQFSAEDILDLAAQHQNVRSATHRRAFYVIFLKGIFAGSDPSRPTLGISIGDSGVIAVFKPVITSVAAMSVQRFVEQSTLIHEFGHSVGLVNNGLPMVRPHHDAEHGAHCTNPNCVMYFQNEGRDDLVAFVNQLAATSSVILFGPECLEDTRAAQMP